MLLPSIHKKVIPRVITGRTPSQFQIPTHWWKWRRSRGGDELWGTDMLCWELTILPSHQCCATFRFKEHVWLVVNTSLIKADIIWAATDPDDRQHLLGAVPLRWEELAPVLRPQQLLIIVNNERGQRWGTNEYSATWFVHKSQWFTEKYTPTSNSYSPNCMDRLLENMKSRQFANPTKILAQIQLKMSALSERTNWGRS